MNQDMMHSLLSKITIFAGIEENDVDEIIKECSFIERKKGDILIAEGTEATNIYIVLKGKIKIILNINKEPFELLELDAGNCVGEASVIGIQKHCASAIVEEDAEFLVLSRKALMDIYYKNIQLFSILILNIARELARRLYQTDQALINVRTHPSVEKLEGITQA